MPIKLSLVLSLTMIFAYQCNPSPGSNPPNPPRTGCSGTFFPTSNVTAQWDQYRRGVVLRWNTRGATPGTFLVHRCQSNCNDWGNYYPLGNWGSGRTFDTEVMPRTTYYYAVRNRYPPCGEYWSTNVANITTP